MAEETSTSAMDGTNQQAGQNGSPGDGGARTFTQDQVDSIVKERLARAKATPPADYEGLRAKVAEYGQLEESWKSDLKKANDATEAARAEAADWKAKFEQAQSSLERSSLVARMAEQYGVNAGTLERMSGDVEDNARYLAGVESARPKFPEVRDGGDHALASPSLDERLAGARNERDRIRIRAQHIANQRRN